MMERTALGEQILSHWRRQCPRMVRELTSMGRLDRAVFETQERVGDLLHELMIDRRMDYQAAWELAREEWAAPPRTERLTDHPLPSSKRPKRPRLRRSRRGTSASTPATASDTEA